MMPEILVNLDIQCAEAGRELAKSLKEAEKVLNDALAVLEEQGPYAMFLYVRARHKEVASRFEESLGELLRSTLNLGGNDVNDVMEMAKRAADELDTLLFARDLLRNALVYARFHLKAQGGE
jgi:hypothetical protein